MLDEYRHMTPSEIDERMNAIGRFYDDMVELDVIEQPHVQTILFMVIVAALDIMLVCGLADTLPVNHSIIGGFIKLYEERYGEDM
jgi:Na+/citrate or Na+/malate symporter